MLPIPRLDQPHDTSASPSAPIFNGILAGRGIQARAHDLQLGCDVGNRPASLHPATLYVTSGGIFQGVLHHVTMVSNAPGDPIRTLPAGPQATDAEPGSRRHQRIFWRVSAGTVSRTSFRS